MLKYLLGRSTILDKSEGWRHSSRIRLHFFDFVNHVVKLFTRFSRRTITTRLIGINLEILNYDFMARIVINNSSTRWSSVLKLIPIASTCNNTYNLVYRRPNWKPRNSKSNFKILSLFKALMLLHKTS